MANYYVAKTGNDGTGTGTFAAPWLTITYALTQIASAGDTIYVLAGTYVEDLTIDQGVVIRAYQDGAAPASVVVQGTVLVLGHDSDRRKVVVGLTLGGNGADWPVVLGNGGAGQTPSGDYLTLRSCILTGGAVGCVFKSVATHVLLEDCIMYRETTATDLFRGSGGGITLRRCIAPIDSATTPCSINVLDGGAGTEADAVLIEDCTLYMGKLSSFDYRHRGPLTLRHNTLIVASSGTDNVEPLITTEHGVTTVPRARVVLADNTITIATWGSSTAAAPVVLFAFTGENGTDLVLARNSITIDGTLQHEKSYLVRAINLTRILCVNNLFDAHLCPTDLSLFNVNDTAAGAAYDRVLIAGNTFRHGYCGPDTFHIMGVGDDDTAASDGRCNGVIEIVGNTILGGAFYHRQHPTAAHGLFVGFHTGARIANNRVEGCGYGIVAKGDVPGAWTADTVLALHSFRRPTADLTGSLLFESTSIGSAPHKTAAVTEPTWGLTVDGTTGPDGNITWTLRRSSDRPLACDWGYQGGVLNNVVVNCTDCAIAIKGVWNVLVARNTIILEPDWTCNNGGVRLISNTDSNAVQKGSCAGIRLRANLIVMPKQPDGRVQGHVYLDDAKCATGLDAQGNLYWTWTGDNPAFALADAAATLAQWQAAGFDTDALIANPQFLDATARDYRLSAQSPAAGAGVPVGFSVDGAGAVVLATRGLLPSIGAYEVVWPV